MGANRMYNSYQDNGEPAEDIESDENENTLTQNERLANTTPRLLLGSQ